jgi:3-dehydroquinate synthase
MIFDEKLMEEISYRSVKVKASVVMEDEKETGLRAILNLGHTLAHALESFTGYAGVTHGEAVSVGLVYAAFLSKHKKYLIENDYLRIKAIVSNLNLKSQWYDLPILAKTMNRDNIIENFISLMKGDKKNIDESIRFILLTKIGKTTLPEPVDIPTIKKTLEDYTKEFL